MVFFGACAAGASRIRYLNSNPIVCRPAPGATKICPAEPNQTIICDACGSGYLVNQTHRDLTGVTRCYRPPFGLNRQHSATPNLQSSLDSLLNHQTMYVDRVVPAIPKVLYTTPKGQMFAGYSTADLGNEGISFELDFKGAVDTIDITCGDTKIGDTLAEGTEDLWRWDTAFYGTMFESREAHLKFTVTKNNSIFTFNGKLTCSVFKFQLCLSEYHNNICLKYLDFIT